MRIDVSGGKARKILTQEGMSPSCACCFLGDHNELRLFHPTVCVHLPARKLPHVGMTRACEVSVTMQHTPCELRGRPGQRLRIKSLPARLTTCCMPRRPGESGAARCGGTSQQLDVSWHRFLAPEDSRHSFPETRAFNGGGVQGSELPA